ncbi:CocE/NonD family hydrolase [Actinomadura madurae]|nr:CocE/NonD family hydrolase [Actinomadura madurae]
MTPSSPTLARPDSAPPAPTYESPCGTAASSTNYDVIEWLAVQLWSDGRIGQMGNSYGAHSALLVAVHQPPHLKAIIPVNGIHDWYENTVYRGGIYSPRIRPWQEAFAPDTVTAYAEHPFYDRFWRGRSVMARWNRLTVPVLEVNGWYDRYRDGMVKNYLARKGNVWLLSGPWQHGYSSGQHADPGFGFYLAWWDRWLRQDASAPLPEPKSLRTRPPALEREPDGTNIPTGHRPPHASRASHSTAMAPCERTPAVRAGPALPSTPNRPGHT